MRKALLLGSVLSLAFAGAANATLIVSVSPSGAAAGQTYATFNSLAVGTSGTTTFSNVNVAFTGNAGIVNGSTTNLYAAPVFSGGNGTLFGDGNGIDMTNYVQVGTSTPNGTATLTFAANEQYLGLLWGSVDAYNTLTLYSGASGTGTVVGTLNGSNLPSSGVNGNQGASGTVYVNIDSSVAFQSIVATSSTNAFEFDDVAFGPKPIPEPLSLAILGSGLIGIAGFRRRNSK